MSDFDSDCTTQGIRIQVNPRYLPERSDPLRGIWVFAYTILISNEGPEPAKLLSRHWIITDSWGRIQEVQGPGVVGEQPRLEPGQQFEYTSFCPLPTRRGTMHGSYQMVRDSGERFEASIATFYLTEPADLN